MNRRGFISLLAGAAGASFVPWRLPERIISLPPRLITVPGGNGPYTYRWSWETADGTVIVATAPMVAVPCALGTTGRLIVEVTDSCGRIARASCDVEVVQASRAAAEFFADSPRVLGAPLIVL